MTKEERLNLAKDDVKQAETTLKMHRKKVEEWESKLDLSRETLSRLNCDSTVESFSVSPPWRCKQSIIKGV